jgi:nitrite reductase/ring-hydroxylating ferredoxin subunit
MEPVAVYRRTIRAALPRIWENVLDWEHLPWLHSSSFVGVELLEHDRDGWRAWISAPPADEPRRSLVDVRLQRAQAYYWTRTLEGLGAGTSIRTWLAPRNDHATGITVEFFVPGLTPAAAPLAGRAYEQLYARLWDEDEAMMMRRQALLDAAPLASAARAPLELGPLATLRARLPVVVGTGSAAIRVVELEGELVAHAVVCPHLGGPLDTAALCGGIVTCPWHGYRFDVRTGDNADGRRLRLAPAPRVQIGADGMAALIWS